MLWCVIALQAMAPFIHAHAGAAPLNHTGFLHVHQSLHGDPACAAVSTAEPVAEVDVAQGMPQRHVALLAANAAASFPMPAILPSLATAGTPGAGLPAPPPLHRASPDHALPHALAPPRS